MNASTLACVAVTGLVLCLNSASAQERRGDGGGAAGGRREGPGAGPGREGSVARLNPIYQALDTNSDGVIDAKELANASVALKKLDKNGDGKITEDEVRPAMGPGRGSGAAADEMVKRLMEFDKNGDGKLSKEELPERMQTLIERCDTDKDGALSKDEIKKVYEQRAGTAAGAPRGERNEGERRPQRPSDDK